MRILVLAAAAALPLTGCFMSRDRINEPLVKQNIDALDRLASEAAANERLKLALDLHDTAIQWRWKAAKPLHITATPRRICTTRWT